MGTPSTNWFTKLVTYNDTSGHKREDFVDSRTHENFTSRSIHLHAPSSNSGNVYFRFDKGDEWDYLESGNSLLVDDKAEEGVYVKFEVADEVIRVRAW